MKLEPSPTRKVRSAAPFILALLLAIALLPAAGLAAPPPTPPGGENTPQAPPPPPPPANNVQNAPAPPPPATNTGGGNTQNNPAPPPPPSASPTPAPTSAPSTSPHPDAPSYPSADCIVTHAATPAQLCPVASGLQYYFIGADGSSQAGPYIKPFSELATLHTVGTSVRLYTGTNPFTSKSVTIDYLTASTKIRVSTYYPDTQYDTDKPYTFTVDSGNAVTHEAW